jgi:hypothetical protein
MAGDWIKMRVTLAKDPRVIAMADRLSVNRGFIDWLCDPVRASCKETAYEHVTRNVTVAVTVSALLQVWGIANETGKPEGEDLILCHTRIDHLDEVCGVPGFGEAMEFVEWAIEEVDCGKYRVRLPKFLINNTPAEDRAKKANAERQRRFREKSNAASNGISNVTGNVTVTHREEKRREEKKEQEATPHAAHDGAPAEISTRFTFKAPEWVPQDEWRAFVEMRRKIRAPLTNHAAKLAVDELEDLAGSGNDPAAVLNQSVMNGWKGLFKLKPKVVAMQPEQREPMRASHRPLTL